MTDTPEWHRYAPINFNPELAADGEGFPPFTSPLGCSRSPGTRGKTDRALLPAGSILPANCDEPRSRFFIPTSEPTQLDRNIGVTAFLILSCSAAIGFFYLLHRALEFLFG